MNDTILVFGTTYNQVPLIRKIQEMGMDAWATSNGDSSCCDGIADRVLEIDTSDVDALLEIVERHRIKGLVTCGTSTAICTIACINEKLDLSRKVVPQRVAVGATMKDEFRRMLAPAGLVPRGGPVSTPEELLLQAIELRQEQINPTWKFPAARFLKCCLNLNSSAMSKDRLPAHMLTKLADSFPLIPEPYFSMRSIPHHPACN